MTLHSTRSLLPLLLIGSSVLAVPSQGQDAAPPTAPAEDLAELPAPESQEPPPAEEQQAALPEKVSPEIVATPDEPKPEIAAEPVPEIATGQTTKRAKRDYSVPYYQQKRPTWGLELAIAARAALGGEGSASAADASSLRGLQIQGEYQPAALQSAGVVGIGASVGLYTTSPSNLVTNNLAGLLSYGYQVRYEAKFLRNQWIVPMVGYAGEWIRYSLNNGNSGTVAANGLFYGGMLLLSAIDEASAAEMYANYGVSRVYLLAEARTREGSDSNLQISGNSYFFGLRFEF